MKRFDLVSFAMALLAVGACSQQGVNVAGTGGANGAGGVTGTGGSSGVTVDGIAGVANQFGETLANSFFMVPCYSQVAQDCITIPTGQSCAHYPLAAGDTTPFEQRGYIQTETFTLGGTMGTTYNLTFTVNGIAEGKYYMDGDRDNGLAAPADAQSLTGTDSFYRGGTPVTTEFYNVYKLVVKDTDGTELAHYYLNSFPSVAPFYENHQTFPIHYTKTIPVPGGGSIDYFMSDSNCHAVDNCGPGVYNGTCTASRNVPNEPDLTIPDNYMGQPVANINLYGGATQPFKAQLIHITVNSVEAAPAM